MRYGAVLYLLGRLFCIVAGLLLLPAYVSFLFLEFSILSCFTLTALGSLLLGLILVTYFHESEDAPIGIREGFFLVVACWLGVSAVGAAPYYYSGVMPSWVDAIFESVSGFTTTGATVLQTIEGTPQGILFWRSFSQWIGGLGIIVLAVAILPQLSIGGLQLMKNEMPGPTFEQLKPRIQQTALSLWKIYMLLSVVLLLLLYLAGMNVFDAICHMFSTIGTGGFSTKSASIAAFSPLIQTIMIFFMFLGGVNFVLHYAWLHGDFKKMFFDAEWRFFCVLLLGASLLISLNLMFKFTQSGFELIRHTLFQVVSITTSTGFTSTNFGAWPQFSVGILFLLMFVGGCAGSTSGGFKQIRLLLLLANAKKSLRMILFPNSVSALKIGKHAVSEEILFGVSNFFLIYIVTFAVAANLLLVFGLDLVTSTSAVIACLSNIGPGFGKVGPAFSYAGLPVLVKVILTACMIIGRLEFFTVLVLFLPAAWKR